MTRSTRPAGRSVGVRICVVLALNLVVVAYAVVRAHAATNNIFTVAGTTDGLSGDGGPATAAQLSHPERGGGDRRRRLSDRRPRNHRVRRVSPAGTITTVAGTTAGLSGDGGPATAAQLTFPCGVAVTADGGFLIADTVNHRVRRVSPAGTITTVAGTTHGLSGDGGPATAAQLSRPVRGGGDRRRRLPDRRHGNDRVRRVSPAGTITTVAGTTGGLSGDGGPATAAQLNSPVRGGGDRRRRLSDRRRGNHRVRRVSPAGTITTVAGTTRGLSGDGGPATAAQLSFPVGVAVTADGGFLIADTDNHRVRRVSPAGTITTVAGTTPGCRATAARRPPPNSASRSGWR